MTILVTRPSPTGEQLVKALINEGLSAYHYPLIKINEGKDAKQVIKHINTLPDHSIIISLSQYVAAAINTAIIDNPTHCYIAIGESTARILQPHIQQKIIYPDSNNQTSEGILALNPLQSVYNKHIIILKGNGGRRLLAETLSLQGAIIKSCECYQRQPIDYSAQDIIQHWKNKHINVIVITSNELLQRLYDLTPIAEKNWLLSQHLIVISARIAYKAQQFGWKHITLSPSALHRALIKTIKLVTD